MLTLLFDGISYGMLLFVLAAGLSITLGLMNVINLAHGAFAMFGGYVSVVLMQRAGVPFLLTLPLSFVATAILGVVLERLFYRHLYKKSHLDHVLFSVGLIFVATATTDYIMGSSQQLVTIPAYLQGRWTIWGGSIGVYRCLIIAVCIVIVAIVQFVLEKTRFGACLRAAVDDSRTAEGLGINVSLIFAVTFAMGAGLAGLGGALASDLMGLDPSFPLKFMTYFLIVVTVGGSSGLAGPFVAALMLGIADVFGKYYIPSLGGFVIYAFMIVLLLLRPQGLFARAG